jgi:hypothetical protein
MSMPVNPELLRQEIEQIVDIATSDVILEKLNQFWELRQNLISSGSFARILISTL